MPAVLLKMVSFIIFYILLLKNEKNAIFKNNLSEISVNLLIRFIDLGQGLHFSSY